VFELAVELFLELGELLGREGVEADWKSVSKRYSTFDTRTYWLDRLLANCSTW